mmetsp:Transcript_11766/g.28546  ORF Transcript_11766/g.28546 Transcript_11766/m.28546 type:complete len:297 (-) Transcript_11766:5974-6864(-)
MGDYNRAAAILVRREHRPGAGASFCLSHPPATSAGCSPRGAVVCAMVLSLVRGGLLGAPASAWGRTRRGLVSLRGRRRVVLSRTAVIPVRLPVLIPVGVVPQTTSEELLLRENFRLPAVYRFHELLLLRNRWQVARYEVQQFRDDVAPVEKVKVFDVRALAQNLLAVHVFFLLNPCLVERVTRVIQHLLSELIHEVLDARVVREHRFRCRFGSAFQLGRPGPIAERRKRRPTAAREMGGVVVRQDVITREAESAARGGAARKCMGDQTAREGVEATLTSGADVCRRRRASIRGVCG